MSLKLIRGKYYVLTYWDREGGKRVQEYVGADRRKAYERLVETIEAKITYWQSKLEKAKQELAENE